MQHGPVIKILIFFAAIFDLSVLDPADTQSKCSCD